MDVSQIITPQVLQNALLIMQKATVTGDQAYVYVQTAETLKQGIKVMTQPKPAAEVKDEAEDVAEDGSNSEAADE